MDYPIGITPDSPEKPHYFYAEPVRNPTAPHQLTASIKKCSRKKHVPAAICITFHTNFTIRPGGHSNFRRSRRFPSDARRPRSAPHKYYLVGKVCGPANINFSFAISTEPRTGNPGAHFTALSSLHPASRSVRPSP